MDTTKERFAVGATHGLTPNCPAEAPSATNAADGRPHLGPANPALSEAAHRFQAEMAALAEETAHQAALHERCAAGHANEAKCCSDLGEWHTLEAQRLYRAAATCRSKAQTAWAMSAAASAGSPNSPE
jgi:hypothetical protein